MAGRKRGGDLVSMGALHDMNRGSSANPIDVLVWVAYGGQLPKGGSWFRFTASDAWGFIGAFVCDCNVIERAKSILVPGEGCVPQVIVCSDSFVVYVT